MPYDPRHVQPMRVELSSLGFQELRTKAEVDAFMAQKAGTALLFVNSVCGCAAGQARPSVQLALRSPARPDRLATVFAGQDLEATARAREHLLRFPPSSPSIALFKDGVVVHFVPRHRMEGRDAQSLAARLVEEFQAHCSPVTAE